jgi:uncharacterized protein
LVKVKVIEVDVPRKRIALSMRTGDTPKPINRDTPAPQRPAPRPQPQPQPQGAMAAAFAKLKR